MSNTQRQAEACRTLSDKLKHVEHSTRDVDTQYVVTYKPKRSFASNAEGEYRRIEVAPARVGLVVSSRKGYVAPSAPKK